jgi:hypothetical protein
MLVQMLQLPPQNSCVTVPASQAAPALYLRLISAAQTCAQQWYNSCLIHNLLIQQHFASPVGRAARPGSSRV